MKQAAQYLVIVVTFQIVKHHQQLSSKGSSTVKVKRGGKFPFIVYL